MQHSSSLPGIGGGNKLLSGKAGKGMLDEGRRSQYANRSKGTKESKSELIGKGKYRGISELLRPKDDDPRAGTWTRWASTKDAALMAALDADFALAEEMLKTGKDPRQRWKLGKDKALGKLFEKRKGWDATTGLGSLCLDSLSVVMREWGF